MPGHSGLSRRVAIAVAGAACAGIIAAACAAPNPSPPNLSPPAPSADRFVRRQGASLLLGGRPFQFTGYDLYNAASRANCGPTLGSGARLASMLTSTSPSVIRVWFLQSLATTSGARDWTALDHVVSVARARGVRLIVTLTDQWGSCETSGYKTAAWYRGGYATAVDPGNLVPYRSWVRQVVDRYRADPTVMGWEMVNEPEVADAAGGSCAANAVGILRHFVDDVGGLIKAQGSAQLVSVGTIGGGQCGARNDEYRVVHASPSVDLCSYHDYGHAAQAVPGDQWNGLAVRLRQCASLGKPVFVGEVGIRPSELGPGATLTDRAHAVLAKVDAQRSRGVVGHLVWMLVDDASYHPGSYDVTVHDPLVAPLARRAGR